MSSIPEDHERELFAVIVEHCREAKANRCRCGAPWPCQVGKDARQQLEAAGVDLGQALGIVWSPPWPE